MLTMEEAKQIVLETVEEAKTYDLIQIGETDELYTFAFGYIGKTLYGGPPEYTVRKDNGSVSHFFLPSDEGFAILEQSKTIWEAKS